MSKSFYKALNVIPSLSPEYIPVSISTPGRSYQLTETGAGATSVPSGKTIRNADKMHITNIVRRDRFLKTEEKEQNRSA